MHHYSCSFSRVNESCRSNGQAGELNSYSSPARVDSIDLMCDYDAFNSFTKKNKNQTTKPLPCRPRLDRSYSFNTYRQHSLQSKHDNKGFFVGVDVGKTEMALSWSLDELGFSMDYVGTGNAFKELLRGQSEGVGRISYATT